MLEAVYQDGGEVAADVRPVPEPGDGEVLVEVGHCGVCGTDIHMVLEGWGRPGTVGGHEWSGRIAAVGPGAGSWTVGTAGARGGLPGCGPRGTVAGGRPPLWGGPPAPAATGPPSRLPPLPP